MIGFNALSIEGDDRYNSHAHKCKNMEASLIKYVGESKERLKDRAKSLLSEIKKADKKDWDEKSVSEVATKSHMLNSMSDRMRTLYKEQKHMEIMKDGAILADEYTPIFKFYAKIYTLNYNYFMKVKDLYGGYDTKTFKEKFPDVNLQYLGEAKTDEGDWVAKETKETVRHFKSFIKKVEAKAGKILDTRYLSVNEKGNLDGYLICENGHLEIETIGAGGYNIQKFHFRTLMKLK